MYKKREKFGPRGGSEGRKREKVNGAGFCAIAVLSAERGEYPEGPNSQIRVDFVQGAFVSGEYGAGSGMTPKFPSQIFGGRVGPNFFCSS